MRGQLTETDRNERGDGRVSGTEVALDRDPSGSGAVPGGNAIQTTESIPYDPKSGV